MGRGRGREWCEGGGSSVKGDGEGKRVVQRGGEWCEGKWGVE